MVQPTPSGQRRASGFIRTLRTFAVRAVLFPFRRARRAAIRLRARVRAQILIRHLRRLKSSDWQRTFCGILLVEHIGDIIACEPVVGWVKREYPDARVAWIVKAKYAEILSAHPDLDAVVTVDSLLSVASVVR